MCVSENGSLFPPQLNIFSGICLQAVVMDWRPSYELYLYNTFLVLMTTWSTFTVQDSHTLSHRITISHTFFFHINTLLGQPRRFWLGVFPKDTSTNDWREAVIEQHRPEVRWTTCPGCTMPLDLSQPGLAAAPPATLKGWGLWVRDGW